MEIHRIQTDSMEQIRSREVSCWCMFGKECKSHKFVEFSFDVNNNLKEAIIERDQSKQQ